MSSFIPINDSLSFAHANESILPIVESLEIKVNDKVLAICGSGEVPFAFLEYGCRVHAIDWSAKQISYSMERLDALVNGRQEDFLMQQTCKDDLERNNVAYLSVPQRLDSIKRNAGNISYEHIDLKSALQKHASDFNKFYFSNTMFWMIRPEMQNVADRIPMDSLFHCYSMLNGCFIFADYQDEFTERFLLDDRLTAVARKEDKFWEAFVYRKIK